MAAAEPHHLDRDALGLQLGEVAVRLVQGEQRVDRALGDQGRGLDLREELVGSVIRQPLDAALAEAAGGGARDDEVVELGALVPGLDSGRAEHAGQQRGRDAEADQGQVPAELHRVVLEEAGGELVPGDRRRDGVDARIAGGGDELDAAAVAGAVHAEHGVARGLEPGLGLLGDEVDQRLRVARLELGVVDHHRAARAAEAAGVPGEHVVAGVGVVLGRAGGAGASPAVSDHQRRRRAAGLGSGGGEEVGHDRRAVEGLDHGVARLSGRRGHCQRRQRPNEGLPHPVHPGRETSPNIQYARRFTGRGWSGARPGPSRAPASRRRCRSRRRRPSPRRAWRRD